MSTWSVDEVDDGTSKHSFDEKVIFHALSFPAKHGSNVMKLLAKSTLSLKDMGFGHLKRMKKHSDGRLLALISPDISISNAFVSSLTDIEKLEMVDAHVPKYAAMTKDEFNIGNAQWPMVFHPNVDVNSLALSEDEIACVSAFGDKLLQATVDNAASTIAIGCGSTHCIVVNPQTNTLIASADEYDNTKNPLMQHAAMKVLEVVSQRDLQHKNKPQETYLCTGYDVYTYTEPCVMCAMAFVHSRVRRVFYIQSNSSSGALGTVYNLHTQRSLNHRYRAFQITPPKQ